MKKILTLLSALLLLGSMSFVQATNYYYRGNQNGWSTTLMTTSSDGFYAYFSANSYSNNGNQNNNFKISTTTDSWDYNNGYVTRGFNGTDIKNTSGNKSIGLDWDNDNICVYCTSDFYILIYFPNTDINTTNKPIICASTTLPDNTPTYTVVGTVPGLNWDQASSTNDMTENNGIYTLLLENVELAVNTYEYKMVKNHSWDVSYPQSGNANFSITEAGIYNVTFTLNLSASPEYSVTPVLIQPAVVIPSVKLYGTFADGTNWAETAEFAIAGNNESASLTLSNLPAGDYQFKVLVGSSYLGNGHTYHRDYTGAENITSNDGNMTLEADVEGDYTFTWTYETNALSITLPAEPTPEYAEIKFFAPRDETNKWNHVYAYSYKGSRKFLGEWPGTEITSTGNAGWYTVSVRKGSNLIFTDNAGMQTNDIMDIQTAVCYESTAINYEADPKLVTVAANANCEIAYYIAGVKELVGGTEDWKTYLPLDENNQIVFHDVEPGTYAFKINNGTWAWAIGGISHMKEGDCATIAQEVGVGDLGFKIDTKQDVTVTYYPETQEICLGAVTVKETATVDGSDLAIKAGESKKIQYTTNNTENPNVTYTVVSGAENIGLFKGVITGVKPGETVIRVSLSETDNYTAASDEFTVTISNAVAPATAIAPVGGKFLINAKGDTAVFARGNLKYNVATSEWYCADNQYDFVGEGGNLHFGDANYTGEFDMFGWSCTASNYGLMQSNHDEVYTGEFVDWGGLFAGGEQEWATPSGSELSYIINHHQWTTLVLDPTPENANNEDEIYGLALFPVNWIMPAGFEQIHYSLYDWDDEQGFADNTIALSAWSTLEAAGAVFMPMAGARAGHWGNTWNGKEESSAKNPNPNGGNSYCWVDNIGWYGYYWSSTTDPRSEHPYDAQYLIFLGWGEGPTEADEDDISLPPQVWSREKRRGNTVRLFTRIPRQYTITYQADDATAGSVPTDASTYVDGVTVTVKAHGNLEKQYNEFAGWKYKDQIYQAGETYTINNVLANEDIVFVAQWEPEWQTIRGSLTSGKYYTLCYENTMNEIRGASLWRFAGKDANTAYLVEENKPYAAGKPYIVYAESDKLEALIEAADNVEAGTNGALHGTFVEMNQAALNAVAEAETSDIYLLSGNQLWNVTTSGASNNSLGAGRAYIVYKDLELLNGTPQSAPGKRVRAIPMQGQTATGIGDIESSANGIQKVLIDGQLYILRGEQLFDATGRMVK